MTTSAELVPVEQVDRGAATDLLTLNLRAKGFSEAAIAGVVKPVTGGQVDHCDEVQAFARHRLAAISLTLEEAIGVAARAKRLLNNSDAEVVEIYDRGYREAREDIVSDLQAIAQSLRSMIPERN